MVRSITKPLVIASLTCFLVSCRTENLTNLDQVAADSIITQATLKADFCTLEAGAVKSKLKFVFIMDKSGSNQNQAGELGTDPDGTRRYNAILHFLNQAPNDATISYALVNFSTAAMRPEGLGFVSKNRFKSLIIAEKYNRGACAYLPANPDGAGCPADSGWTSYTKAFDNLSAVGNATTGVQAGLIRADIDAAKADTTAINASYYVVFLITDGAPIVGGIAPNFSYESDADIMMRIDSLKTLAAGANKSYVEAIQVHSLFYYNSTEDATAVSLLGRMADRGSGEFVSVSSGREIDFTKFSVPVRKVKHSLRDVLVENVNSVWWEGSLLLDNDGDSLPDSVEQQLGSDPDKWDSDENGISDGVEFKSTGSPCKDVRCSVDGAEPFTSCSDLRKAGLADHQIFGDLDKDFLNDCEERVVLKSSLNEWDSNSDWIPDELAYRFLTSFVPGSSERDLDPDGDRSSNYREIKENTPPYYANDRVSGLKKLNYKLQLVSDSPTQTCYHLDFSDLASVRPNQDDMIRLYLVENTSIIDDKRFMRSAQKRLSLGNIEFVEGDFK